MATVIVYATKTGSTEKAAQMLSERLGNCDTVNISKQSFDLAKYDTVIIGSYIRMGTVDRNISRLMLSYISVLIEKKTAFFICNCFEKNAQDYISHNVPPQLLEKMIATDTFGGELDLKKLGGFDRIMANKVIKADREKGIYRRFSLESENIEKFAEKVKENYNV